MRESTEKGNEELFSFYIYMFLIDINLFIFHLFSLYSFCSIFIDY